MKTMQIKSLLFAFFGLCLGLASCTPVDEQDPEATLSVDPPTLTFAIEGETKEVTITTNQKVWDAVCVLEANSEWCTLEKADGKLKIIVAANTTMKDGREAVVKVTAGVGDNVATEEITVIQGAPLATITVEPATLDFVATGATKEVIVTTNQETWSATCYPSTDSEWCTVTKEEGKLIITIGENTSTTAGRSTIVKVMAGVGLNVATKDITVTQAMGEVAKTYTLGGLYEKGGVKGIVVFLEGTPPGNYEPVREGTHGLIISLDRYYGDWEADGVSTPVLCANQEDGRVNMAEIKGQSNWQTRFPAAAWCDALNKDGVTGWYMPALGELEHLAACYSPYGYVENFDAALLAAGGKIIDPGVEEGDYRDPPNYKVYGKHYSSTIRKDAAGKIFSVLMLDGIGSDEKRFVAAETEKCYTRAVYRF